MFCQDTAIQILFSILFLSSTGNDNKSNNSEPGFGPSFATNNTIVSDVNEGVQGQCKLPKSITDSLAETCPVFLNTSQKCFPTLKKRNSSFELYNLTDQTKERNLIVKREILRLYAETSSNNKRTSWISKPKALIRESFNYIFNLNKSQKSFIILCYLYAISKYYGARFWAIICKIRSVLFGKLTRVILRRKISPSERVADLPSTPSEKTVRLQNIAGDELVNTDEITTSYNDLSCGSHVDSDDEITAESDISCASHMDSDDVSSTTSSSVEDLPATIDHSHRLPTTTPISPVTTIDHQFEANLKHSLSFDSWDSLFDEESCDEDFPDEFFLFPTDCGNIGFTLGPDDWEKIEPEHSSHENLSTDEGGTASTGMRSGQGCDVVGDGDSKASSHSYRDSLVPMEMVSCLSCDGSVGYPAIASSDHVEVEEESVEHGGFAIDSFPIGDDRVETSLDDCDMNSEDKCSENGSITQQSDREDNIVEVGNNVELANQQEEGNNVNRWVAIDIEDEDEIFHEDIVNITVEQRVKNHAIAAAIFAGTFVLPCFIAAKLLK